jgi:hypothetical protein
LDEAPESNNRRSAAAPPPPRRPPPQKPTRATPHPQNLSPKAEAEEDVVEVEAMQENGENYVYLTWRNGKTQHPIKIQWKKSNFLNR